MSELDFEGTYIAKRLDVPSLRARATTVAAHAEKRAADHDADGAFPIEDIDELHREGLLLAPFPAAQGGEGLGVGEPDRLRRVLTTIGHGSLTLGRLFEGHVNAVALTSRYGSYANLRLLWQEAQAGRPSGVWMAGPPLRMERDGGRLVLRGGKILCSGAGQFRRPLIAADHDGGSQLAIPLIDPPRRAEAASWTAQGMRATATGSVDFDGIVVHEDELVGAKGDYLRSPYFRGGAWRVIAVQLGGLEAVLEAFGAQLRGGPHCDQPLQLARYGEAEIACETARLWVKKAARLAEGPVDDAAAIDAYVDLARNAFEGAALNVVALAQKVIGLKSFLRPNPLERLVRDLTTYLRQPNLDMSLLSAATYRLQAGRAKP